MIKIDNSNKQTCVGCGACMQACPCKCISMKADDEGFLYPSVDTDACSGCGRCEAVCPVMAVTSCDNTNNKTEGSDPADPVAVGGFHKNEDILEHSSSGGAFSLFADRIIDENGVVCACKLDDTLTAVHSFATSPEDIASFCGSKYVQSDIGQSYLGIKEYLQEGRKVLFVGTPCQCAGLRSYLGDDPDNLIVCDFICHGVPSPLVFKKYIEGAEKAAGEKITEFRFRTKDRDWVQSGMQQGTEAVLQSGKKISKHPAYKDEFMNGFLSDIMLRPSCYECAFKSLPKSYSDITIADFWGVGKVLPKLNNPKGTSLILLNSAKGISLFESVKDDFEFEYIDTKAAIRKNRSIIRSSPLNSMRYYFFDELKEKGYESVSRKYFTPFKWAVSTALKRGWGIIESVIRAVLGPLVTRLFPKWDEKKWESLMQFFKFSLVGVSNSVVSYTINILTLLSLRPLGLEYDYIIANLTAFTLSVLWSYNLNSKHVFTIRQGEVRSKGKTLLKTYASYAFSGIILNNVLGTFWIKIVGISRFIAPLLNLVITIPTNFILNKYWAYRRKDEKQA